MEQFFNSYPFWAAWWLFFVVGMLRGQGTYWIARLVSKQTERLAAKQHNADEQEPLTRWQRIASWLNSDATARGKSTLRRIGIFAIPACYLTVGLQSVVLLAAGLIGITWAIFTAAQIPGVVAWATIYSTVGFMAWISAAEAVAGQWWPLTLFIVAVAVAFAYRRKLAAKLRARVGAH